MLPKTPEMEIYHRLRNILEEKSIPYDQDFLEKVYHFGRDAHQGQYRHSGHPYICHPLETACFVASLGADATSVYAAILHDVPEDTTVTLEDIQENFGAEVATIVEALTKLSKVYYKMSMGERQLHALRKLCLQTAQDPRVLVVKLADRYHNMLTLQHLRIEKQHRIAKETLEIYAPLARLYGIYDLGQKLEDACFKILQKEEYEKIHAHVHEGERRRRDQLDKMKNTLEEELKREGLDILDIHGRPKNYYSIYRKMIRDQKKVQEIYDLYALRILVPDEKECYRVLGLIHKVYKPKPSRFKDYIAIPKANGYQSLHTTVVGEKGEWLEVQIRSFDMHQRAEYGVASHQHYKGASYQSFQKFLDSVKNLDDVDHFLQELQDDFLQEKMMIFSPKGDVIMLAMGSCAIDYMYALSLDLENHFFQALVNGKVYSLMAPLHHGDTIEIVYLDEPHAGPQSWWLKHVKTNHAKRKIHEALQKKSYEESVAMGQKVLELEFSHENKSMRLELNDKRKKMILTHFQKENWEDVLLAMGRGELTSSQVYSRIFPEIDLDDWQLIKGGLKMVLQRIKHFAKVPDGVRIPILIQAYDRPGLLREILDVFYDKNITLLEVYSYGHEMKRMAYELAKTGLLFIKNDAYVSRTVIEARFYKHEDLISVFDRLELIPGVMRVSRIYRPNQIRFYILAVLTILITVSQPFLALEWLKSQWLLDNVSLGVLKALPLYVGHILSIFMLFLLRGISRKTFPQFGETKHFWFWSFSIIGILIATVFIENYYFDLGNHLYVLLGISCAICLTLWFGYHREKKKMADLWKSVTIES